MRQSYPDGSVQPELPFHEGESETERRERYIRDLRASAEVMCERIRRSERITAADLNVMVY